VLLLTGVRLLHELKKKGSDHNAERRGGFLYLRQFFFQAVMHRHRSTVHVAATHGQKKIIRSAGTRVQVSAVLYVLPDEM
jgi:DNA primase catalytic subunit